MDALLAARRGLTLALALGGVAAVFQPLSGDLSARKVAEYQPAKLAAAEAHYETTRGAPLTLGGIPTGDGEVRYGIRIPRGLSLLAHHDPDAEVLGLEEWPESERPNVLITHLAFQVMVGLGFALLALTLWFWWVRWRNPASIPRRRALLLALDPRTSGAYSWPPAPDPFSGPALRFILYSLPVGLALLLPSLWLLFRVFKGEVL